MAACFSFSLHFWCGIHWLPPHPVGHSETFLKTFMKMSGFTISDLAGTNVPNPCSSEGLILILFHKIADNTATAWPPKSNLNDISAITYTITNTVDTAVIQDLHHNTNF